MAETVKVDAGNKLYSVKVPAALRRGMVLEWPEGKDPKFAIVGLGPEEIHGLLCQIVAQTHQMNVAYRAELVATAYTQGVAQARREAGGEDHSLPVMDAA